MREVILSAYELEYFDEDLIAVLYKSVSFRRLLFIFNLATRIPHMIDAVCALFHQRLSLEYQGMWQQFVESLPDYEVSQVLLFPLLPQGLEQLQP